MKRTLSFTILSLVCGLALAHAKLRTSSPADGAAVASSPAELRLQYNEPVETAMSTVKLTGPGEAAVTLDAVAGDPTDDKTLIQRLPRLPAGDYRVQWTTMGRDGHHTQGEIRFAVK
jgi:copper resistance protein C